MRHSATIVVAAGKVNNSFSTFDAVFGYQGQVVVHRLYISTKQIWLWERTVQKVADCFYMGQALQETLWIRTGEKTNFCNMSVKKNIV